MTLLTITPLGLGALLGLYLAAGSVDTTIYAHGLLLTVFCVAGIFWVLTRDGDAGGPVAADASVNYNDGVVRAGVIATTFWGVVGFLVGLVIALQLAFPVLNLDLPWTTFGRLRPLHTSAVIFAFGGNALIMTSFYVVQRTCRARLAGGFAPWFVFWGYQLVILMAATGYVFGITQGKEYAEPEW
jgi:cytochrome c oxidase cbb3-type subunit 1